jgi:hypothetical protein
MAAILREGKIIAILSGPRSLGKARSDLYATIGFTTYQVVRRFASVIIAGEITTLGSRYTNHTLFDLPEYEQAFSTFTYAAIHELMNQKEPVLGSIKRVKMPVVPVVRNTLPSGQVVENEPVLVKSPFSFPVKDAISGNVESLLVAIDDAAEDGIRTIMPQFFRYLDRLSEAAGTGTDAKGRPPSHELLFEALEKMDIEFDEEGKAVMPTLIMHPDMAQALWKLPPPTPEQNSKFEQMMQRKKQEYNDRRRHRKLS